MISTPSLQDEIGRQLDLVWGERYARLGLTVFAFGLTTIYLPVWIAAICCAVDIAAELYSMKAMRGLDPKTQPSRYRCVLVCTFAMEFAFALCASLIWMLDVPFAKPFAMGMIMTTLLHVASIRAIHLPFGLSGTAGVMLPLLTCNAVYWIMRDDWTGLVLSTVCALAGAAYIVTAMMSNHATHRNSALQREAAQDADHAKSRFLAQMSHELRTPLNAILGMGHAELRRSHDALSQKRLSVLIASAEGLSTILDDILDMSAVQQGRLPIRPLPVVPRTEILATLALFQPGIDEAGLLVRIDFDPGLDTPALLDPQRLRQCLSNLLSNALKHTASGEIGVRAVLTPGIFPHPPMLWIEVSDTGAGIPADLHEAVFEPFFRSPELTTALSGAQPEHIPGPASGPSAGGAPGSVTVAPRMASNGLGLSISRAMARQMGGDLVIVPGETHLSGPKYPPIAGQDHGQDHGQDQEFSRGSAGASDAGIAVASGTTFRLSLPLAPVPPGLAQTMTLTAAAGEDRTDAPDAPVPASSRPAFIAAAGLRVLVVDDIATNRLVASTYLRMLGASMIEASSGPEALLLLRETQPDLILLDMNMPGMDGLQTLARIRALPGHTAAVPVIAMTADAMEEHRKRYLDGGLDGYLTKPINPARIEAEITAVLSRRRDRPARNSPAA